MPPFAGVGVNVGMLDALHLTNFLTDSEQPLPSVHAALSAYYAEMTKYVSKAQTETADAEAGFHGFNDQKQWKAVAQK